MKKMGREPKPPACQACPSERDLIVDVGTGIRAIVHQCAVSARGAVTEAAALLTVAIVAARRADRGTKVIAALRAPPRDAVAIPLRPEERDRERLGEARVVDRALKEDFAGGIFGDGFPESTELDPAIADVERDDLIRSEEHTSELQSLMRISYAVFCLKKKTQHIN